MSTALPRNGLSRAALSLLLVAAAACGQTPTDSPSGSRGDDLAPAPQAAQLPVVPPGAEREIRELLDSWEDAWSQNDAAAYASHYAVDADFVNPLGGILAGREAIRTQHVFLFGGPFAGSTQTATVRRLVALSGTVALVDLNVALTGYAGLPPGLSETAPGVVWTRSRMVVAKNTGRWEIVAQQLTRMNAAP